MALALSFLMFMLQMIVVAWLALQMSCPISALLYLEKKKKRRHRHTAGVNICLTGVSNTSLKVDRVPPLKQSETGCCDQAETTQRLVRVCEKLLRRTWGTALRQGRNTRETETSHLFAHFLHFSHTSLNGRKGEREARFLGPWGPYHSALCMCGEGGAGVRVRLPSSPAMCACLAGLLARPRGAARRRDGGDTARRGESERTDRDSRGGGAGRGRADRAAVFRTV